MKRTLLIALAVIVLGTGAALAQVVGTAHDLSSNISGGTSQQVCVFCHTPHGGNGNGLSTLDGGPLWNQSVASTAATYLVYTSQTFQASDVAAITNTTYSVSLLCMSCHDGGTAPGNMYNPPNNVTVGAIAKITGNSNLGTDLSNHHPVNFTYATSISQGDTGLEPATDTVVATYLTSGKVQCSSCHDPHDQAITKDPDVNFMNNTLDGSALCLDCHIK